MVIWRIFRKSYQYVADRPFKKGTILQERYHILKLLGTGSYGMAYLCMDVETSEIVVVKQLRPSKRHKPYETTLFQNEINLLAQLSHPQIPRLRDAFTCGGQHLYAMSYIEGDNLDESIFYHKLTFNEHESLVLTLQLLELADHLHSREIYHLDLRIPNIMFKDGEPFLIDFGLARNAAMDSPGKQLDMRRQDYYDLGDILLYLLYTTYTTKRKKALPWTEELCLANETVQLLKRLLGLLPCYTSTEEIHRDLMAAIEATAAN